MLENPDERFNYISGGLTLVFSLFMGMYFIIFSAVLTSADFQQNVNPGMDEAMPDDFFKIMLVIFMIVFLFSLLLAVGQIVSGRLITLRKLRWFSFIVAIINLIFIPYGTILGVFTLIVLERNSVKEHYLSQSRL